MKYLSILLISMSCWWMWTPAEYHTGPKMGGVSLVAPVNRVSDYWVKPVQQLNADWVALLPYAYSYPGKTKVNYDIGFQWWGERKEGVRETLAHAKKAGFKVLLKPMVWIPGAWPGGFDLQTDAKWQEWEENYSNYILGLAKIGAEGGADMISIGTEFKIAAAQRPDFWRQLSRKVRAIFPGKVTYAANWDNFHKISFWDELDYIGVDAYFPLSENKSPSTQELKQSWKTPLAILENFAGQYRRPILFTEFGYRSVDRCAWKQWELESIPHHQSVNLEAQTQAYRAFFESFWEEEWFAGVFLWQWYHFDEKAGGQLNSDYTPQNKPAEGVIREWYGK